MLVRKIDVRDEIGSLDVIDHRVITGVSARRTLERIAAKFQPASGFLPFFGVPRDRIANLRKVALVGTPSPSGQKAAVRFDMEVKPGTVHTFFGSSMAELHGNVGLIGTLVGRKAHVPVDSE